MQPGAQTPTTYARDRSPPLTSLRSWLEARTTRGLARVARTPRFQPRDTARFFVQGFEIVGVLARAGVVLSGLERTGDGQGLGDQLETAEWSGIPPAYRSSMVVRGRHHGSQRSLR